MRKYICLTLCLLLCASCLTFFALADTAELTISNADQFLEFAENCRLDSYSQNLTVKLAADIDLTDKAFDGIPIFYGTFNGDGHTISGIKISNNSSNTGLFRYVAEGAVVTNLKLNGTITPGGTAQTVGGIAGSNAGTISGCSVAGEIAGTDSVGGIAGINTGIIEKSIISATVSGDHFVGGIAGQNSGTIRSCKNTGTVNVTEKQNQIDISDIALEDLTDIESATTATDIGGIVGNNTGTVEKCENAASVGYQQIGYNIGGIAGSNSGFISGCKNTGAVSGRKDVGGIVGQLEPGITLIYSKDTFQILAEQMEVLSQLIATAKENATTASTAINEQLEILETEIKKAEDTLNRMFPENTEELDLEVIKEILPDLRDSLTKIDTALDTLTTLVKDSSETLSADLDAISKQIEVIEGTLKNAEENLKGTLTDISEQDTAEDTTGKVANCTNSGAIHGDRNIGGIAGTINIENDLDPDADVDVQGEQTFNQACEVRAVIRNCSSTASITSRKQNTGGIVGSMYLGLVRDCSVAGTIAASGDYIGGIAGNSLGGFIRSCYVKVPISGGYCVGGIAGNAVTVSDCLVLTQLSGTEALGAVLGKADDLTQVTGNYYMALEKDIGAIDGISYTGHAEPLKAEAFLALESLPELFLKSTVTFLFPDSTTKTVAVIPGATLTAEQIPPIPEKDGNAGIWVDKSGNIPGMILFDTTFEASYTALPSTLESTLLGAYGRPVMLAQGYFPADAVLTVEQQADNSIGCWKFSVTPGSTLTTLRLQIPQGYKAKQLLVQLCDSKGTWRQVSFTENGSYLVFSVGADDVAVRLVEAPTDYTLWFIIGAAGIVVLASTITIIVLVRRKKKKKIEAEAEVAAEVVTET